MNLVRRFAINILAVLPRSQGGLPVSVPRSPVRRWLSVLNANSCHFWMVYTIFVLGTLFSDLHRKVPGKMRVWRYHRTVEAQTLLFLWSAWTQMTWAMTLLVSLMPSNHLHCNNDRNNCRSCWHFLAKKQTHWLVVHFLSNEVNCGLWFQSSWYFICCFWKKRFICLLSKNDRKRNIAKIRQSLRTILSDFFHTSFEKRILSKGKKDLQKKNPVANVPVFLF